MAFRDRLLLGLVLLALVAAGVQAGLGFARFRAALERDRTADLEAYGALVASVLDTSGAFPEAVPERLPVLADSEGRFRVVSGGAVVLEGGGRFPEPGPAWRTAATPLPGGAVVEVALENAEVQEAIAAYLRTSVLALAVAVAVAVLLATALRGVLVRPLARLRRASDALAAQRFPDPIAVPGNDELGRLARAFNAMAQQVRRALERERAFTRYASHELRTPLASLRTTAEAVRQGALPADALLPVAERSAERMERTLEGLLALARAPGAREAVAARALVDDVTAPLAAEERARLRVRAEAGEVHVPRAAFEGAARNLLDNALRHSDGRVWLSLEADPARVRLRVTDEGPGVPPDVLAGLGEPFRRGPSPAAGSGLGLAFTRQLADELGGRLELENRTPRGFEARLTLPNGGGAG